MKKTLILGGAVAAIMASTPVLAEEARGISALNADTIKNDAYASASIGFADLGMSEDATIVTGLLGTNLDAVAPNLGAEVEMTLTLADAETNYMGMDFNASYFGLSGYATYSYALGEKIGVEGLDLFGRAGLGYTSYDYEYADGTDVSLALGVGVNYDLAKQTGVENLSLRAEYTDSGLVDEYKVGVTYRFRSLW